MPIIVAWARKSGAGLRDIGRGGQPGYPAIGRLKGLAELRGVELALSRNHRAA